MENCSMPGEHMGPHPACSGLCTNSHGSDLTFQSGSIKAVYTLDNNTTVTPAGDVNGLKTRAHWEGWKLHLHYKRGQNWCRDVLSVNGNTLTILRDLESGGGSTTRTITYTKTS